MAIGIRYFGGAEEPDELSTPEGARELAGRLTSYWERKGATPPQIVLETSGFHEKMRAARVEIRSDMVDGWPPALRAQKLEARNADAH